LISEQFHQNLVKIVRCRNGGRISHTRQVYPILCYNFQIFVAMAMWVGLTQTSLAQLNSPTPMTPTRCRNRGHISHTSRVIANFLSKFSNFRCHGNEGWSGTNFSRTVKFDDNDNPLLGAGIWVISPIQAELLPIFCQNFQISVAMATRVGLAQISLAQLNSTTPITPY